MYPLIRIFYIEEIGSEMYDVNHVSTIDTNISQEL